MATLKAIEKIREGLTPVVTITAFKHTGNEIIGKACFKINGFGFPVINQCTFKANNEGNLLALNASQVEIR